MTSAEPITVDTKPCYEPSGPATSVEHEDHVWSDSDDRLWYCTGLASALINRPFSRERQERAVLKHLADVLHDDPPEGIQICSLCRRERALGDGTHPMDSYDYNPMQAITGQPLGWYSGDDGEVCPECMTSTMRGQ